MWKGVLSFDHAAIPVKLFSAAQDRGVHFRLLHDQDMVPVQQRMINPNTGKEVAVKDALKGALIDEGRYVLVRESDLKEVEPPPSRDIVIERFVPDDQINHQWYDRPYYLAPDDDGQENYWALRNALKKAHREGVARWTMRNREYLGALRVSNDRLMLVTLHTAEQVVSPGSLESPGSRAISAAEKKMAKQLVSMLEGHFDPTDYEDEHRHRLLAFMQKKARGEKTQLKRPRERKAPAKPLASLLSASIQRARKEHAHGR